MKQSTFVHCYSNLTSRSSYSCLILVQGPTRDPTFIKTTTYVNNSPLGAVPADLSARTSCLSAHLNLPSLELAVHDGHRGATEHHRHEQRVSHEHLPERHLLQAGHGRRHGQPQQEAAHADPTVRLAVTGPRAGHACSSAAAARCGRHYLSMDG